MNVPNVLTDPFMIPDGKGGFKNNPVWIQYHMQINKEMQTNLSNEGFVMPSITTTENLAALSTTQSIGRIIYDQTTGLMKLNNNGTYQIINVT